MFFKKINIRYGLQVTIAVVCSIILATYFKVTNPLAAGVVTLASIQTTKKETLILSVKRFAGFVVMIGLVTVIYNAVGFNVYSYGIFIFIFISLNSIFDSMEILGSNAVMASTILIAGNTQTSTLMNELIVFLVGVGIGVIVNLLVPVFSKNYVEEKDKLDDMLKELFYILSDRFKGIYEVNGQNYKDFAYAEDKKKFDAINKFCDDSINELKEHSGNMLLSEEHYYTDYFEMRKRQIAILMEVWHDSKTLDMSYEEAHSIGDFLKEICEHYHETNTNIGLLTRADELLECYRQKELPKTRKEFETRAILYHNLSEIIDLLIIKYEFVKGLSEETREKYWIGG